MNLAAYISQARKRLRGLVELKKRAPPELYGALSAGLRERFEILDHDAARFRQQSTYQKAIQTNERSARTAAMAAAASKHTRRALFQAAAGTLGYIEGYASRIPEQVRVLPPKAPSLDQHLSQAPLGSHVIAIDPFCQEERIYQVTLTEVARSSISTAKLPGRKQRGNDGRTPENKSGECFRILETVSSQHWADPFEGQVGAYGPYFARIDTQDGYLAAISGGKSPIGLHGTLETRKLGSRASHGCIRHHNRYLTQSYHKGYLAPGTPVVIKSGLFTDKAL